MRFLALVASCLLVLAVTGCGGDDEGPSSSDTVTLSNETTDPPSVETETGEEDEGRPSVVSLYFLRDGQVGLARRSVSAGPRVGTAALRELLAGPTSVDRSAGLATAIPMGTRLERLSIVDGVANVQLSSDLSAAADAQVVYTLTQFPTVRRVSLNGAAPIGRAELEDLTPPIFVETPAPGDEVSSPLRITGTANTFEATFQVEVVDSRGKVVGKRFVTATSGSGTRGTFDAQVPFRVRERGPGKLLLFELSAEDGSRIHEVEIPLELLPPATS